MRSKVLLPILENCSIEDEEDMHDRWHNLLANAAAGSVEDGVLPAFAEILKQLTSVEAYLIERAATAREYHLGPALKAHFREAFPGVEDSRYRIAIDTLLQQRLLEEQVEYKSGANVWISSQPEILDGKRFATQEQLEELVSEVESAAGDGEIDMSLRVTELGTRFVQACSEPTSASAQNHEGDK